MSCLRPDAEQKSTSYIFTAAIFFLVLAGCASPNDPESLSATTSSPTVAPTSEVGSGEDDVEPCRARFNTSEKALALCRLQGIVAKHDSEVAKTDSRPAMPYKDRLSAKIAPNVPSMKPTGTGKTVVLVFLAPEGEVLMTRIEHSSGNREWDKAVIAALKSSSPLPKDDNCRAPSTIRLAF